MTGRNNPVRVGSARLHADFVYASVSDGTIRKYDAAGNFSIFAPALSPQNYFGLAFDGSGNFYAANGNNTIQRFDANGNRVQFASLNDVYGLAFNGGYLYAASVHNNVIMKYDSNGNASVYATFNDFEPLDLAFDASGNLYASGSSFGTIMKFDSTGQRSPFGTGYFLAVDQSGHLYSTISGNPSQPTGTIMKYDSAGNGSVFASSVFSPGGLAFDSGGNLYVSESGAGTITEFDPSGNRSTFANLNPNFSVFLATQVPEPSLAGFAAAGVVLATFARRRNHKWIRPRF